LLAWLAPAEVNRLNAGLLPARWESSLQFHLEIYMAEQKTTAQGSAAPVSPTGKPFGEMTGSQKITWLGKVVIMLVTGGFAFPNIFVE
jgi:hypothetical protein